MKRKLFLKWSIIFWVVVICFCVWQLIYVFWFVEPSKNAMIAVGAYTFYIMGSIITIGYNDEELQEIKKNEAV